MTSCLHWYDNNDTILQTHYVHCFHVADVIFVLETTTKCDADLHTTLSMEQLCNYCRYSRTDVTI